MVLVGAIVLVLLIACSNVASLLMARGSTRASELAVRASLGATGSRLARHLLAECTILAVAAGGMGVVLAVWLQDAILGFLSMDRLGIGEVGLSGTMLGIAVAVSLATMRLAVATAVNPYTLIKPVQERIWALDRDVILSEPQSMEAVVSNSISSTR